MIPPRPDRTARRTSIDLDAYDDAALVTAHLAGPAADRQAAFAALMRRHKQPLYRLILAQIGDPDEALDLLQDSFVAAHAALSRYDRDRSLRAWLARIAINKCRDWHRRRRVRHMLARVLPIEAGERVADGAADIETNAIGRDDLAADDGLGTNAERWARRDELDEAIGAWTGSLDRAAVLAVLD